MTVRTQRPLSVGGRVFVQSHAKLGEHSLRLGGREHERHHARCGSIVVVTVFVVVVVVVVFFAVLLVRELVWRNVL